MTKEFEKMEINIAEAIGKIEQKGKLSNSFSFKQSNHIFIDEIDYGHGINIHRKKISDVINELLKGLPIIEKRTVLARANSLENIKAAMPGKKIDDVKINFKCDCCSKTTIVTSPVFEDEDGEADLEDLAWRINKIKPKCVHCFSTAFHVDIKLSNKILKSQGEKIMKEKMVGHFVCNNCDNFQRVTITCETGGNLTPEDIEKASQNVCCSKCGCESMTIDIRPANFELSVELLCKNKECGETWTQIFDTWSDENKGEETDLEDSVLALMKEDVVCPFCNYEMKK